MKFHDRWNRTLHLTQERWSHILDEHHEISLVPNAIKTVLRHPDFLVRSVHDAYVVLYYRFYPEFWKGKYIVVVVKTNHRRFVLTAYVTDRVKGGKIIWPKD